MNVVLSSLGASLSKKEGLFCIDTAEGSQSLPPASVTSITVSKGARISSDAVLMAIEHEIDVLFVDGHGHPKGRVWSAQYGSTAAIRKAQLTFLFSPACIPWVQALLARKIANQTALLLAFQPDLESDADKRRITAFISSIADHKDKIGRLEGTVISDVAPTLRGWEGAASRRYFEGINLFLPAELRFERRSQNPATDAFNAMLNYGYGILYGKVEGALIRAGIDPYVGIFHRDDYNRPALVYDCIEQYRLYVDFVCLSLARQNVVDADWFTTEANGAFMLQGLGKRILIQSMNDYLAEIVLQNGLQRSRLTHLQNDAYALAKHFTQSATH